LFPKTSLIKASKVGEKLHFDLMGPLLSPTLAGSRFILVFTNDFSQKNWVYFLESKVQTYDFFCNFIAKLEIKTRISFKSCRLTWAANILPINLKFFVDNKAFKNNSLKPTHLSKMELPSATTAPLWNERKV